MEEMFPVLIFGFIVKLVQVEQLEDQLHTMCGNGPFEFRNTGDFYEFRILSFCVNVFWKDDYFENIEGSRGCAEEAAGKRDECGRDSRKAEINKNPRENKCRV